MDNKTLEITTKSPEETKKIAKDFAGTLRGGEAIILFGELGSGKTTFVQGLAESLGVKARVTSPTFIIMKHHRVQGHKTIRTLVHADLYRIDDERVVSDVGLQDALSDPGSIVLVEWGEKMGKYLPARRTEVRLQYDGDARKISIKRYE